jgi:hypothetical protein
MVEETLENYVFRKAYCQKFQIMIPRFPKLIKIMLPSQMPVQESTNKSTVAASSNYTIHEAGMAQYYWKFGSCSNPILQQPRLVEHRVEARNEEPAQGGPVVDQASRQDAGSAGAVVPRDVPPHLQLRLRQFPFALAHALGGRPFRHDRGHKTRSKQLDGRNNLEAEQPEGRNNHGAAELEAGCETAPKKLGTNGRGICLRGESCKVA